MLILHFGLLDGKARLWAEASAQASQARGPRHRKLKLRREVPLSPYDDVGQLAAAAREALALSTSVLDECRIWLPTVASRPTASSALISAPLDGAAAPTLSPWTITTLPVTGLEAATILARCVGREILQPGLVVGVTLAFAAQALRFAGRLVARQQYLPSLQEVDRGWRAVWRPVVVGDDAVALAQMAKAMPPVFRALSRSSSEAPSQPAADILAELIGLLVDALVRESEPSNAVGTARAARGKAAFASVHDQWMQALHTADGRLRGNAKTFSQLAEQVREWRRPLDVGIAAPFRVCFRLEEPASENPTESTAGSSQVWMVRYLLQAHDDPSLVVTAGEVWHPEAGTSAVLNRYGGSAREVLLAGLGQAAALCPPIETSLRTAATPGGYVTDATGAHTFLSEFAPLLDDAGFGVQLPGWWTSRARARLALRAVVRSPARGAKSGITLQSLVNFDWKVALGDQELSEDELVALARLKVPLVRLRGQWVQLRPEDIVVALRFLQKKSTGEASLQEVVRMALGSETSDGLPVAGVTGTGWVADFLKRLEERAGFEELPPPTEFNGNLRPYQQRGFSWLAFLRQWGLGACLADDMGLGKTVQTLAVIQHGWKTDPRPTLLICPTSVVSNWHHEARRFTPDLPVLIHHGPERSKAKAFAKTAKKSALVLTSYSLLHRDLEFLSGVNWSQVVLDEAQNIKNPETKQSQAARSIKADGRVALTGTPVENHVGDLWPIMEFLNPGMLGNQAAFRRNFFLPIQAGQDPDAAARLKRLTGPFILRRLKTDKQVIADLPDKVEMKEYCTLTKEQASLYQATVDEATTDLDTATGIKRKGVVLALLTRLKQVCNHPAQFLADGSPIPGRSGKLTRVTDLIEEILANGEKVLLFTQFTEMGELLKAYLQETFGKEVLFLHGGVSRKARDLLVRRFQTDDDGPRIFILSLKAGGTGLNLTQASQVIHFDRWWNPAVEDQATDRAFRIGQTRNVMVHKFVCTGTLEEQIDDMIDRKKTIAGQVVGAGEGWLTELSTDQLKDLFRLRPEALGE